LYAWVIIDWLFVADSRHQVSVVLDVLRMHSAVAIHLSFSSLHLLNIKCGDDKVVNQYDRTSF